MWWNRSPCPTSASASTLQCALRQQASLVGTGKIVWHMHGSALQQREKPGDSRRVCGPPLLTLTHTSVSAAWCGSHLTLPNVLDDPEERCDYPRKERKASIHRWRDTVGCPQLWIVPHQQKVFAQEKTQVHYQRLLYSGIRLNNKKQMLHKFPLVQQLHWIPFLCSL